MDRNYIIEVIKNIAKENNIKLDVNNLSIGLKEIGVDSLAMMNLIFKIESQLKVQLPDEVLVQIKNLDQLISAFMDQLSKNN
ncbi:MAG: acyl carrier protein [Candidatus Ureaplasma intestinipullorum]|uniref:Acyl carrier protein n=1 Tax=Candidatus Ureaplasma intestinipullorum TaxID=2838770 RepID=A0A9E2KWC6_9BACT|nr:acyl carrier protein [Candidatus Ureaplasma intestinipullorum]